MVQIDVLALDIAASVHEVLDFLHNLPFAGISFCLSSVVSVVGMDVESCEQQNGCQQEQLQSCCLPPGLINRDGDYAGRCLPFIWEHGCLHLYSIVAGVQCQQR